MLGISTSGGVGFAAKVYPHRYGYVGRLVGKKAKRLPQLLDDYDRRRIAAKVEGKEFEDVLEDIRLSEGGALYSLDTRAKSHREGVNRRGQRGMGRRARHTARASIIGLDSLVPEGCMSFFTATCPEIDWQTDRSICASWHKVVDNFIKRLRRMAENKGVPAYYVHVTEIQPRRWKREGRPYLHLHLVFQGRRRKRDNWAFSYVELKNAWLGALNSVAEGEPYYLAVCDVRPCDGSISKYLSKYLSKGSDIAHEVVQAGLNDWFPRQWWGCARAVVAEREHLTYYGRGAQAAALFHIMAHGGGDMVEWLHPVILEDQKGRQYTAGYCFALTEAAYTDLMLDGPPPPPPNVVLTRL